MSHQEHEAGIRACHDCASACDHLAVAVAGVASEQVTQTLALSLDCADACRLAASFMARGSEHRVAACRLCCELCERCAEACDRLAEEQGSQWAADAGHCAAACRAVVARRSTVDRSQMGFEMLSA